MPHRVGGPVPTAARSGREKQKYGEHGERLVAGSIPVRFKPGVEGPDGVEVLLISSRKGKGHVFPKGGWEVDEELREAAMRETVEEAGVRGELEEPIIGKFPFYSGKAERLATAHQGRCMAYLFVMHVSEELPAWPEAGQRTREWCSLLDACQRCRYEWMREALITWMRRKGWDDAAAACQHHSGSLCSTSSGEASPAALPTTAAACAAASPAALPATAACAAVSPEVQPATAACAAASPAVQPTASAACAAVMATGQVAEVAVPSPVERIAVRT